MNRFAVILATLIAFGAQAKDSEEDFDEVIVPDKGRVAFVSCLGEAYALPLAAAAKQFYETAYVTAFVTNINSFSQKSAKSLVHTIGADLAVFLIDDPTAPAELLAMTERWALVNVAALRDAKATPAVLDARIRRLLMRHAGFLAGATIPRAPTCLMCGAASLADIDAITSEEITFDLLFNISRFTSRSGIDPGHKTDYRSACELGVAPKPVNDHQRKIWDEFHAMPKKPIKIKFDPKEGR